MAMTLPQGIFDADARHQYRLGDPTTQWRWTIQRKPRDRVARNMQPARDNAPIRDWKDGGPIQSEAFRPLAAPKMLSQMYNRYAKSGRRVFLANENIFSATSNSLNSVLNRRDSLGNPVAPHRSINGARGEHDMAVGAMQESAPPAVLPMRLPPFGSGARPGDAQQTRGQASTAVGSRNNESMQGTLYLDGLALSRWLTVHLGQEATRPRNGTIAVDLRATPAWTISGLAM